LSDLNHPFDPRPEAGPPLPQAYPGRNRLSLNRNPLPRCAAWPASDFDIRASGKFGGGNSRCGRGDLNVAQHSTAHCSDRTVRAGIRSFAGQATAASLPAARFRKEKLCAVAPAPICGQQIGKMRV
jgi:hypothetical protein